MFPIISFKIPFKRPSKGGALFLRPTVWTLSVWTPSVWQLCLPVPSVWTLSGPCVDRDMVGGRKNSSPLEGPLKGI